MSRLSELLQRASLRYGRMLDTMFGTQGTGVDLGGWDGEPSPTQPGPAEPPASGRDSLHAPTPGAPAPPRHKVTTFGPGGDNVPLDVPEVALPPQPPPEDDSNPAAEHDAWMLEKSADWARPERGSRDTPTLGPWTVEDYIRMRDADPLLQPGTPLGDMLHSGTTWPCAIDLGEHILVARVDTEGCAPTMDVHQGKTLEQFRRDHKTPTCSHFSVTDCG